MIGFLVAGDFQHNKISFKKGQKLSFEQIDEIMEKKQFDLLVKEGCLKEIEIEEPVPAPVIEEELPITEEAPEGKKKKGKK